MRGRQAGRDGTPCVVGRCALEGELWAVGIYSYRALKVGGARAAQLAAGCRMGDGTASAGAAARPMDESERRETSAAAGKAETAAVICASRCSGQLPSARPRLRERCRPHREGLKGGESRAADRCPQMPQRQRPSADALMCGCCSAKACRREHGWR